MRTCRLILIVAILVPRSLSFTSDSNSYRSRINFKSCPPTSRSAVRVPSDNNPSSDSITSSGKTESDDVNTHQALKVRDIEKFARLPVWPAWNGVLLFLVGKLLGESTAARLENTITGRVCPNFFNNNDSQSNTSPFIMLVHHCHTFCAVDPLRYLQRTFFPEGFPSHPHRGFITLTYILHGGFIHRDSTGVQQLYGNDMDSKVAHKEETSSSNSQYGGKHSQWLNTGAGMLHEEMFDIRNDFLSRQELYQLWINLPASEKLCSPSTTLLGGAGSTPTIVNTVTNKGGKGGRQQTLVLAGSYQGHKAETPVVTPMTILHVTLDPNTPWKFDLPDTGDNVEDAYDTIVLYMRQGSVKNQEGGDGLDIPTHYTAYFEGASSVPTAKQAHLSLMAGDMGADFLLLAGAPIREPCAAQGSMVMNTDWEISQAYSDYQKGNFGTPWDHKLSDAEWLSHVEKHPSKY